MIVSLACCLRLSLLGSACKCTEQGSVAEVIEGIEPAKLQAALQGRTVKEAHRKGKHMWLEFDSGPCLMLHFGKHTVIFEAKSLLAYAAFTGITLLCVAFQQCRQLRCSAWSVLTAYNPICWTSALLLYILWCP